MKVIIVTLPLVNNYGGLLQNFALQTVLKRCGHSVLTYNLFLRGTPIYLYLLSWLKSLFLFFIPGKRRRFVRILPVCKRSKFSNDFIGRFLEMTSNEKSFSWSFFKKNHFDVVLVGSDQVWRPKYNHRIADMYLNFIKNKHIKKIAYAASFGVDKWEYSPSQSRKCSVLAKKFNAISVREESGVNLCKTQLGVDAAWVLDPTLLLRKEDFCALCKDIPYKKEKILVVYVLDENDEIRQLCESVAAKRGLVPLYIGAESNANMSVPEWLAMFRDASYVVTDSFHGTVFSIIFEKEFNCVFNRKRGSARFESLLKLYASGKIDEMRESSISWLKKALES